MLLHCLKVI